MIALFSEPATPSAALLATALATYFWRGLGVMLSHKLSTDQPIFHWVSAIAFAMLAGLIARLIIFPGGALAQTELTDRLAAAILALAIFYWTRRNLALGVFAGAGVFMLLSWGRAL